MDEQDNNFQLETGTRPSAVAENIATNAHDFEKDSVVNESPSVLRAHSC